MTDCADISILCSADSGVTDAPDNVWILIEENKAFSRLIPKKFIYALVNIMIQKRKVKNSCDKLALIIYYCTNK